MKKPLAILSSIITLTPFILLLTMYPGLPDKITGFVDVNGNPTLFINKNILSVFRLPLMGAALQVICFTMACLPLNEKQQKNNQFLWLTVALLAAVKMSLTSMEIMYTNNPELFQLLRKLVLVVIVIAVCFIAVIAYQLYKSYNGQLNNYYIKIDGKYKTVIIVAMVVYFIFAIAPMFIKASA